MVSIVACFCTILLFFLYAASEFSDPGAWLLWVRGSWRLSIPMMLLWLPVFKKRIRERVWREVKESPQFMWFDKA